MEITDELVDNLANLSRLEFNSEEKQQFKKDFANILSYIDMMEKVDVKGVEFNRQMLDAQYNLRDDEEVQSLSINQVTLNAPKSMGGAIVVPTVVEEE